jgi:hypothetical protein
MRYKAHSPSPRYIGGVDKYDVYITRGGNVIARYGEHSADFVGVHVGHFVGVVTTPLDVRAWAHRLRVSQSGAVSEEEAHHHAERIVALLTCFAPDLCATHNKKETT